MPDPRRIYSSGTGVMSILMVLIGVALIVRTLAAGGGVAATGIILGLLFLVAGGARLYVQSRRP
ncbi:MAG: hypothetical protein ACR2QA_01890 [Solirubrobacteraceae bacterium]